MPNLIRTLPFLLCVALLVSCGSGVCPLRSNCRIGGSGGVQWVAPSGTIDTTFGTAGTASTDFFATNDTLQGIAVQSDGKIVAVGYTTNGANAHLAMARFSSAGSLDTSFGTSGKVFQTYNFNGDFGQNVFVQSDGKIMVVGETFNGVGTYTLATRFSSAGVLDTAYGAAGYFQDTLALATNGHNSTLLSNNNILTTYIYQGASATLDFAFQRILSTGVLDTSFGTAGYVETDFNNATDYSFFITTDASGKIIVAGRPFNFSQDFGATRYSSLGVLDTSFAASGKYELDFVGLNDAANSALVQSDGKIVLTGEAFVAGKANFALARLTTAGALDTSFGTAGSVTTNFTGNNDHGTVSALQPDGKILLGGTINVAGTDYFALARYKTDGSLDTTFGAAGIISTHLGAGNNTVTSIAQQPDGKIILAGYANISGTQDFAIIRIK